jgi:hypothetical protein
MRIRLAQFAPALGLTLALTGSAFAQQPPTGSTPPSFGQDTPQDQVQGKSRDQNNTQPAGDELTRDKVRQGLENSGFKDIEFLEQAYVVRATNDQGKKVVMVISPRQIASAPVDEDGEGKSTTGSGGKSSLPDDDSRPNAAPPTDQ